MSAENNAANPSYEQHPTALMKSLVEEVVGDPAELERSLRDRLTAKLMRDKDRSHQKDASNATKSDERKKENKDKGHDRDKGHSKSEQKDGRKSDRSRDKRSKDDRRDSKRDRDEKSDRTRDRKEDRKRPESSRYKSHDDRKDRGDRSRTDRRTDRHRDKDDNDRCGEALSATEKRLEDTKPPTEAASANACPFDGPDLKRRRLAVMQSSSKNGAASSESIAKELQDDLEAYVMESDEQKQPPVQSTAAKPSAGALKPRFSIGITSSSLERIMGQHGPPAPPLGVIPSASHPSGEPTGAIQKASSSSSSHTKVNAPPTSNSVTEPSACGSATTTAAAAASAAPAAPAPKSAPAPAPASAPAHPASTSINAASSKRSSHSTSKPSSSRAKANSPRSRRRSPRSSKDYSSSSRRRDTARRSRRRSRSSSRSSSRGRRRSPPPRRRVERSHSRGRREEKPRGRRSPSAPRESRLGIDKKKLRRIAIMNVLRSMRIRVTNADSLNPEQLNRFKASGISAEEVHEICQRLVSKKEKLRAAGADDATVEAAALTEEEDVTDPGPGLEGGKPLKIKDRFLVGARAPDVQPLLGVGTVEPLMGSTALREMFPVSSGILHRTNGSDPLEAPAKATEPEQPPQLAKDLRLGQYTGKVEVKLLSQKDLEGGVQPWVKKNQFMSARPVQNSIGEQLLRQMGWKLGEGLGKNNDGKTQPVHVDIKVDRKGLASYGEKVSTKKSLPTIQELKFKSSVAGQSGKHPVSVLLEQSNKRRWSAPVYTLVAENGPSHAKTFTMSVQVNGKIILSDSGCRSKKDAKMAAAAAAVRQLGLSS